eukprot:2174670-Prymnesium_polylepis.1
MPLTSACPPDVRKQRQAYLLTPNGAGACPRRVCRRGLGSRGVGEGSAAVRSHGVNMLRETDGTWDNGNAHVDSGVNYVPGNGRYVGQRPGTRVDS